MKILMVNTSELTGGAAIAAKRLMTALNKNGVKARMLVRDKQSNDPNVLPLSKSIWHKVRFVGERALIFLANGCTKKHLFDIDTAWCGVDITQLPEFQEADIINLHWTQQGLLSLSDIGCILNSGKPIVWTMHDLWPITGICHHPHTCDRYTTGCHHCPLLTVKGKHDLAYKAFNCKQRIIERLAPEQRPSMVAVSTWLKQCAKQSAITHDCPITVIPNTIDTSAFPLKDKNNARKLLSIHTKWVIAFGAHRVDDPIKGLAILTDALRILTSVPDITADNVTLLIFGNIKDKHQLDRLNVKYLYMGYVSDSARLSTLYAAADCVVNASSYETFGQTLIEAMACGCPAVSFGNSGQADIIHHKENGYLVMDRTAKGLAEGLRWTLTTSHDRKEIRADVQCRFSADHVAKQYIKLFESHCKNTNHD